MSRDIQHRNSLNSLAPHVHKAFFGILCVAVAALLVVGCATLDAKPTSTSTSNKPSVKVGIDIYEPYTYYDDNGQITGFDYELAVAAFDALGYTPEFIGISWEHKDELLESGAIDCIWSCYSMTGREEKYLWAGPYMKSHQAAVVRAGSDITSLSQLEGHRIGVEATTKSEEAWTKHAGSVVPAPSSVLTYTTAKQTFSALRLGYVDAVSTHVGPASALVKASGGTLALLPEGFYDTQIGVAFHKDYANAQLVSDLSNTLKELNANGTSARIAQKYGLDAELLEGLDNE